MPKPQNNVTIDAGHRLTHLGKERSALEKIELTALKPDEIRVKTLFSGVSRGTERLVYQGKVPRSEWQSMRCPNQVGEFSFPVTYGYACVGEAIEIGENVSSISLGQRIFTLHPHQDIFTVDAKWVNPLPSNIPADRAVLSANMETALNAVWDADLSGKTRIAVIGAGVVGLLTGYLAHKLTASKITIIDLDTRRSELVAAFGAQFKLPEILTEQGLEFDTIFNTSASGAGLQTAIDHAAFEAQIIEMSWYGNKSVSLSLGSRFHSQRLKLISSQVGSVSPKMRENITHSQRLQEAMKHLNYPILDQLLHPRIPFRDLPSQLSAIFDPASDALCPLVTYIDET